MGDPKTVVMTGVTGSIGRALSTRLMEHGYLLCVFSRDPASASTKIPGAEEYVRWQPDMKGPWSDKINGAYAVIHLAGAPIFLPHLAGNTHREMVTNRVLGTRGLVNAIGNAPARPQVFISASSVAYYGGETRPVSNVVNETDAVGRNRLAQDHLIWEGEAEGARLFGVRTVIVRTGVVLDRETGGLPLLARAFRRGLGPILLPQYHWQSWIHLEDEVSLFLMALENPLVHGALNATAPKPEINRNFAAKLGQAVGRRPHILLPTALFSLLMGQNAPMFAQGRRVIPAKALAYRFQFRFPALEDALHDLL